MQTNSEQSTPVGPLGSTVIATPSPPAELLSQLDTAARRGKLPGFHPGPAGADGHLFEITDFGTPFEARLCCQVETTSAGSRIVPAPPRLKPVLPLVFAAIMILTIWPGSWLTDSMLRSYSDWYSARVWWVTYAWYLPLTVPFAPLALLSAIRKSRAAAASELPDILRRIAEAVGGRVESGQ